MTFTKSTQSKMVKNTTSTMKQRLADCNQWRSQDFNLGGAKLKDTIKK